MSAKNKHEPHRAPKQAAKTLQDYLLILRERWLVATAIAVIAVAIFAWYSMSRPPVYHATAEMLFEKSRERVVNIEGVDGPMYSGMDDSVLQSHFEEMTSRAFLLKVADSLDDRETTLVASPYAEEGVAPSAAQVVRDTVAVSHVSGSRMFRVTFKHRNPDAAALLANRFASEYMRHLSERTGVSNQRALSFLGERAEELREQIEAGERDLQNYRQEHNLVSLEENQNIIVERLKNLNNALTEARVERLAVDSQVNQVEQALETGENLLNIPVLSQSTNLQGVLARLDEARAQRELLGRKYLERHPRLVENQELIDSLERLRDDVVGRLRNELLNRQQGLAQREERLHVELASAEAAALNLDRQAIEYNVLRRALETNKRMYDQILARLNETSVASHLDGSNVRVIDQAIVPANPVSPNPRNIALSSIFLFGLIFVGVPVAMEFFDNKLKSHWDVEQFLRKEFLGEIPRVKDVPPGGRCRVVMDALDDPTMEYFRAIYSQIQLLSVNEYPRITLLTSTMPGEGKTFVSANLAATFAKHGKRTLLIDCDLRRPQMHSAFGYDNGQGVIKWFEAQQSRTAEVDPMDDPALGITEVAPRLYLLRAGGRTRQPTELIGSESFANLVARLRLNFDQIIIDNPPAGAFPDTVLLSAIADETLYVCKHNHVNRHKVKFLIQRIDQAQAETLGIIFNQIRSASGQSYGFYGFYDEKTYKSYYGGSNGAHEDSLRRPVVSGNGTHSRQKSASTTEGEPARRI